MAKRGESAMGGKKKSKKKKSGKSPKEISIRRGASGGYIAKHTPKPGDGIDQDEHAIPDLSALHDHIDTHFGDQQEQAPALPSPQPGAGMPGIG